MSPAVLTINDADSMLRRRVNATGDRAAILNPEKDWAWVTLMPESADASLSISSTSDSPQVQRFGDTDAHTLTWVFRSTNGPVYVDGLKDGMQVECFAGGLPEPLARFMTATDRGGHGSLEKLLGWICLDRPLADAPEHLIEGPDAFEVLRGCAAVARRLGLFTTEAELLSKALDIRWSSNVVRLLSYAHANAQNYRDAIIAADAAIRADPKLVETEFQSHLDELQAYNAMGAELEQAAQRRSLRAPADGKIAYCLHNALPYGTGGYAMRSHALARSVRATGRDLAILVRPGFPSDGQEPDEAPTGEQILDGVPYHFQNGFGRRGRAYGYIADSARYFEEAFAAHDVAIAHAATNFWTALPAAMAAFELNIPFVYEVRSFWTVTREARIPNFSQSPLAVRDEALESIVLAMADEVVTLNGQMRDRLIEMGADPDRITIVPNSVDPEEYASVPTSPGLASEYGIEAGDVVIGYMGAMLSYEGIDLLIDAVAPMAGPDSNIKVLLVGANPRSRSDPASLEYELAAQIERQELGGTIRLVDRVSPATARQLYQLFDICVYPRRALEVCELVSPLKPLEAMAAGKTVIGSDVKGLQDIIRHDQTGLLFAKEDVSALRATLKRAIDDGILRKRLGASARTFVRRERDWSLAAEKMGAVYDRALSARGFRPDVLTDRVAAHFFENRTAAPKRHRSSGLGG